MYRAFSRRDELSDLELHGLLLEFWIAVSRVRLPQDANGSWLGRVERLLKDRYQESVSPYEIAQEVAVHPAHLMREFRRRHGCTVGEYVRAIRVERACELLRCSKLTCAEVAHTVGFADQSHFNRTFRQRLGVTPMEYVKQVGGTR